jgi:oxalate decarboxylase/phosphoglucose isomerase-like protein (cupin superfamily)
VTLEAFDFIPVVQGVVSYNEENQSFAKPFDCNCIVELVLKPSSCSLNNLVGHSHLAHDDYLRVLKGNLVTIVLHNKQMHYIPLNHKSNQLLHIPKLRWHTVININDNDCLYQNWMRVWQEPTKADYKPILVKHTFDLELAQIALTSNQVQIVKF